MTRYSALLLAVLLIVPTGGLADDRPNILFVIADDGAESGIVRMNPDTGIIGGIATIANWFSLDAGLDHDIDGRISRATTTEDEHSDQRRNDRAAFGHGHRIPHK